MCWKAYAKQWLSLWILMWKNKQDTNKIYLSHYILSGKSSICISKTAKKGSAVTQHLFKTCISVVKQGAYQGQFWLTQNWIPGSNLNERVLCITQAVAFMYPAHSLPHPYCCFAGQTRSKTGFCRENESNVLDENAGIDLRLVVICPTSPVWSFSVRLNLSSCDLGWCLHCNILLTPDFMPKNITVRKSG